MKLDRIYPRGLCSHQQPSAEYKTGVYAIPSQSAVRERGLDPHRSLDCSIHAVPSVVPSSQSMRNPSTAQSMPIFSALSHIADRSCSAKNIADRSCSAKRTTTEMVGGPRGLGVSGEIKILKNRIYCEKPLRDAPMACPLSIVVEGEYGGVNERGGRALQKLHKEGRPCGRRRILAHHPLRTPAHNAHALVIPCS